MLRTMLLFPCRLLGRCALGSIRFLLRVLLGALSVCGGGLRGALLGAMAFTLLHVGISVLTGQPNLSYQIVLAASIGAGVGTFSGVYRAWTRPKALPTPPAFRPSFCRRLLRGGKSVLRTTALVPVVGLFAAVVFDAVKWEVVANGSSPAADPNPLRATKSDLSIMDRGHPASALAGAEGPAGAALRLEARPVLLASLAKVYADPRFSELAVARAVFQNTTTEPVTGYRVRFRLTGYTADWSPWSDSAQVLPKQTVTTPYFPILDEPRLAQLEGFALADLHVEQEYHRADGQRIQHREIRRVKVMARNWMAWFHSIPEDQAEAMMKDPASPFWRDVYTTMPLLLASFVTKDDPVIQQVAGWVSGQAGGAPLDDAGARRFMKALYEFMVANGIRYQLPAESDREGWFVQHVHYGRDVLRNRAGCCMDLTIFYASVCAAVNLEPVLILVPEHIFPAIRLPQSKELLPVEVTLVNGSRPQDGLAYLVSSYAGAVTVGQQELKHYRQRPHLEVDIAARHKAGVQGLQLPPVPANVLASWGIHSVAPTPLWHELAYWVAFIGGFFLVRRLWQLRRPARQLRNKEPQVRFQAVAALTRMGGRWSTRLLRRALQDCSEDVRQAAQTALQLRGEEAPVTAGLERRRVGLPSLGAGRRALLVLAAGEFDTVVVEHPATVASASVSECKIKEPVAPSQNGLPTPSQG